MHSAAVPRPHDEVLIPTSNQVFAEKGTRVSPSWRSFPDETYVFSKDSRPPAQTRLLHGPKCSQAVSTARESTNYIVEQPLKPALNLSL